MNFRIPFKIFVRGLMAGLCLPAALAAQARIEGRVTNGTLGQPAPHQEVRLLMPQGGMQQVATATTDAEGRFAFPAEGLNATGFYLVEARYGGVAYHRPAKFDASGTATVDLTVYEVTQGIGALRLETLRVLVRAEGSKARIWELFSVLNPSQPPRAFVNPRGTLAFHVSPGADDLSVSVMGLMNMPLPQSPVAGKEAGEYSIQYPIKPGVTQVTIGYAIDYKSSGISLQDRVGYPADRAELYVSPSSLTVVSASFKPAGLDASNDMAKFEAQDLPRGAALGVRVAGEAATPQAEGGGAGAEVKVVPSATTQVGVMLLGCFLLVLLWALGLRLAKEWPQWRARRHASPEQKQLGAKFDYMVKALADLDELFASGKIAEGKYWKERLELKARLVAILKKATPALIESYAGRHTAR